MKFYSAIHNYYDHIFPLNVSQIEYVSGEIPTGTKILDIGCATGSLALSLAKQGYVVHAFDIDESMINAAKQKNESSNPTFRIANMLDFHADYSLDIFDGILCFGNTLVHLTDYKLVERFFSIVHSKLKTGGKFLFQILNYRYILDSGLIFLPKIDNEHITFIREYNYLESGLLNFKTKLIIKEFNEELNNEIELLPITQLEAIKLLTQTGFKDIEIFGSFAKTMLKTNSITLVVKAEK